MSTSVDNRGARTYVMGLRRTNRRALLAVVGVWLARLGIDRAWSDAVTEVVKVPRRGAIPEILRLYVVVPFGTRLVVAGHEEVTMGKQGRVDSTGRDRRSLGCVALLARDKNRLDRVSRRRKRKRRCHAWRK